MSIDTTSKVLSDVRQHFVGWILALISLSADALAVLQWLRDDIGKFTPIFVTIGLSSLWLGLFYIYAKKQSEPNVLTGEVTKRPLFSPMARGFSLSGTIVLPLCALAGFWGWRYYQSLPTNKTIILVADFEGPDPQSYRVTETIVEQLREATKKYPEVQVKALGEMITAHQGSERARQIGTEQKASIMLWGWYSKTKEKALVNAHFEILRTLVGLGPVPEPSALISDIGRLESFEIQTQLSHKTSALSLLTLGIFHKEKKDYDGAIEILNDALEKFSASQEDSDAALIYYYRGLAYYWKQNYDHAIADFNHSSKLKADLYESLLVRGYAYFFKWDWAHALESLNQATKLRPNDAALYFVRANVHDRIGNYDFSLADYSRSIELGWNDWNSYLSRGRVYARINNYDLALRDFNKVIQLNPNEPSNFIERSRLYAIIGKSDLALADYRRALTLIKPNSAAVMNNVAWDFATHDEHLDEALKLSQRSLKLEPEESMYWDTLAEIYFRLDRFEEAKTANDNARRFMKDGDYKLIDERAAKIEAKLPEAAK